VLPDVDPLVLPDVEVFGVEPLSVFPDVDPLVLPEEEVIGVDPLSVLTEGDDGWEAAAVVVSAGATGEVVSAGASLLASAPVVVVVA